MSHNPLVVSSDPHTMARSAFPVISRQLFRAFHELAEVCAACQAFHKQVEVIGHERVRTNCKPGLVRRTQKLLKADRNQGIVNEDTLSRFCKKRSEIEARPEVRASW